MAKIKAVFDADILFHIVKTGYQFYAKQLITKAYIAEYVYDHEIKKGTREGKAIELLEEMKIVEILYEKKLNANQKVIYQAAIEILDRQPIQEGEKRTAAFAKAYNLNYYMSDDNNAASFIKVSAGVNIINFCDLLLMHLHVFGKDSVAELTYYYNEFVKLYETGKEPNLIKDNGRVLPFKDVIIRCMTKFMQEDELKTLLESLK